MKKRRSMWLAGAAMVAAGSTGCGDLESDAGAGASASDTTVAVGAVTATPSRTLPTNTNFFIPLPGEAAAKQVLSLIKGKKLLDAARVTAMEATPRAVWFTKGTPAEVKADVKKTVAAAAALRTVPVLVAYNVPFRDCAQYSAGGAVDTAAYKAWIDGFAQGIGSAKVVVILEPDSLGIIPFYTSYWNSEPDWCQPKVIDASGAKVPAPGANPIERFAQLNYAIDSIHAAAPSAIVYLDGTHSAWLGANEAAHRLMQGGITRADGFFQNASNYQATSDSIHFGTWVSSCIALINGYAAQTWWDASWGCPNQYVESPIGSGHYVPDYSAANVAAVDAAYAGDLAPGWIGPFSASTHFVIDTSRNGRGPLDTSVYANAPSSQPADVVGKLHDGNWCNPPGAGLGPRPTANTGVPLLDAELWIKSPGESDGSCDITGGARAWDYGAYNPWSLSGDAQNHFDPLWGMVDPAAGDWFSQQALQLAQNATPPLF